MNHTTYLKKIRFVHYILLLCAIFLAAFGSLMGGVIAFACGFLVVWKFHRCPKCSGGVDILLRLDKTTCCPTCGYYLKDGTEPEEMREARERAEAEAKAKAEAEAEAAEKEAAEADTEEDGAETAEQEEGVLVDKAV